MTQYVGTPIVCWMPTYFHGSWIAFTNNYCWVKNTYYLPWENVVPFKDDEDNSQHKEYVQYYQWIPFILIAQVTLKSPPNKAVLTIYLCKIKRDIDI